MTEDAGRGAPLEQELAERLRGLTRWRIYIEHEEPNSAGAWVQWRDI